MDAVSFGQNLTTLGSSAVSLFGDAGMAFMQEPYIYLIALAIGFGAISLAGSFLLRRRGARRSRR